MLISPFSDLLGDYEFNVELDYDENMDELELHSAENPEVEDGTLMNSTACRCSLTLRFRSQRSQHFTSSSSSKHKSRSAD